LLFVAGALLFPLLPGIPPSWITLAVYAGLASLVTLGLVLLTGVGGMTSFGQAAFVGVGAYATAYLTVTYGISAWITLPASLIVTGLVAMLFGAITVPLAGHYLAIATIAWGMSAAYLFGTVPALGLNTGIFGIPAISIAGYTLNTSTGVYYLVLVAVAITVVMTINLLGSRAGRALRTLRGNSIVAKSFGVDTGKARMGIFIYSAVLAGLSGWIYAHYQRAVSPPPFGLNAGLEYLLMA